MANNLIIYDSEIAGAINLISTYAESLTNMINSINAALKTITDSAINDNAISAELLNTAKMLEGLKEPINMLVESIHDNCMLFLRQIDEVDQFLY